MPKKLSKKTVAQKQLYDRMGFDPFTVVVALVLLFIASVLVFPSPALYNRLFANSSNSSNATNSSLPVLEKGAVLAPGGEMQLAQGGELASFCVLDLQAHGVGDDYHLSHCLAEYEQEKAASSKAYGEECDSHQECPPSIVWTQDAHHGECPAGVNYKCSLRCTSGSDCFFKTGGVLNTCCRECAAGQPFGFCR